MIQIVKETAKIDAPIRAGQIAACIPVSIVSCPDVPWSIVNICTINDTSTVIIPAIHPAAGAYAEKISFTEFESFVGAFIYGEMLNLSELD